MFKPNAKALAMRDPALAALMGVENGSDFGAEFGFGFGDDTTTSMMAPANSAIAGVSAIHPAVMASVQAAQVKPTASQAISAWHQQRAQQMQTASRQSLLDPNGGSDVHVERYTFSLNGSLVLGTASSLVNISNNPDTQFRPQQVTINAPAPGFLILSELKVANVSVTVGGQNDAYQFNANGVGRHLDLPTLSPANRASFSGNYLGYTPPGYTAGGAYTLCVSFTGPASMAA